MTPEQMVVFSISYAIGFTVATVLVGGLIYHLSNRRRW